MLKEELEKRRWLDAQKSALQEKLRKIEAEMKNRHSILRQLPTYLNAAQQACSPLSQLILNTSIGCKGPTQIIGSCPEFSHWI